MYASERSYPYNVEFFFPFRAPLLLFEPTTTIFFLIRVSTLAAFVFLYISYFINVKNTIKGWMQFVHLSAY